MFSLLAVLLLAPQAAPVRPDTAVLAIGNRVVV